MVIGQINNEALQKMHGFFLFLGVLLVIFGFFLMIFPIFATFAIEIFLGAVLFIVGIVNIALAFTTRKWKGFVFFLLNGLLSLIVGALLLFYPISGIIALTLLIGILLIFQGIFEIGKGLQLKPSALWKIIFVDGIFCLLLGLLVLMGWPSDSAWAIGLLFGISLFFAGITSIIIASAVKKNPKAVSKK